MDPFTGRRASDTCGLEGASSLWRNELPYMGFSIYDAGFTAAAPKYDAIARGKRSAEPHKTSPAFIFYISYFGPQTKDEIKLTITKPNGETFNQKSNITLRAVKTRRDGL